MSTAGEVSQTVVTDSKHASIWQSNTFPGHLGKRKLKYGRGESWTKVIRSGKKQHLGIITQLRYQEGYARNTRFRKSFRLAFILKSLSE